ncbi:MAG: L,D-transpeptidase [Gammaproteobacteria bacterium]|nr:L,D-transpeptidase [Gammaproteobacteria bacterium]
MTHHFFQKMRLSQSVAILITALFVTTTTVSAERPYEPWILIDTTAEQLFIKRNDFTVKVFGDIAIGRGGAAQLRVRDDGKTPLGDFKIAWIGENSKFHLFFGLNYPNLERAQKAYDEGEISRLIYYRVKDAITLGKVPPQNTKLGGYLGIHGLGNKDLEIHQQYNWTLGCVALTNKEIEELALWLKIGTRVVIR